MRMKLGLIGGSGLGAALSERAEGRRHYLSTPFGTPSDVIVESEWSGVPVLFLSRHGPGHLLNPSQVPYRANIFALKQLGCTHLIASGAVGSLREQIRPRDLVVVDQVIDKTTRRAGTFYEKAAVHVEFAEPFCPVLRRMLVEASDEGIGGGRHEGAEERRFAVHDGGCYVCMEGPAFSTRSESLMHRLWGGDVIGMTAMPEAKLAREAEISYALVALVTDYDCWKAPPPAADQSPDKGQLLNEIIANLQAATKNGMELIGRVVAKMAGREAELMAAPSRQALELAIWSEKSRVEAGEVQRLHPLWGRHFDPEREDHATSTSHTAGDAAGDHPDAAAGAGAASAGAATGPAAAGATAAGK